MAEKSSELDLTGEPDAVSTAAGANQDTYLEARSDDYSSSDSELLEIPTNTDDAPEETEHLKAQIEETRSQMGETIDAIQEKLSIQNISDQVKEQVSEHINQALETAKETVYDATIGNLGKAGKFMQNVGKELSKTEAGKFARKNPFPLVLIGLGVGLLAYEFSGKKRRPAHRYYDEHEGRRDNRGSGLTSSVSDTLKSATGKIGDTASGAYESVSNVAGNALSTVGDKASSAYEGVTSAATNAYSSVTDYAGNAYEKVGEYSVQAREQYDYYIEENPLAVGAVALAIGAAVGLAIPSTRYEGELLGEYRQQLLDKAQTAAGDLVDKAKEVASEAQKTLSSEVKTAVDETKKTFASEAKNQGFITDDAKDKNQGFTADKPKSQGFTQ
ncbi:MAG TPA: DUF3618 domain-containing protein [Pyrinomonadaceae bacterium]|jgi:ElaB/YqjD/DUF883 family membrane-anchored ribosome-binding protein|nr:DUF3618 domain-containing protein [Pyrinomonadaceae bacterium]